jgi:hypothetical protein
LSQRYRSYRGKQLPFSGESLSPQETASHFPTTALALRVTWLLLTIASAFLLGFYDYLKNP